MLEDSSFRNQTADFIYMLFLGMISLLIIGPFLRINFLGSALTFMIVYIWARRNPYVQINFLGVFNFTAPYLPWVFLGFSFAISNTIPINDFLGIVIGHIYYFLQDVYPKNTGRYILKTPFLLKRLVDGQTNDSNAEQSPLISEQPPLEAQSAEGMNDEEREENAD